MKKIGILGGMSPATNTMHIVFEGVQRGVRMPLLSIAEATAGAVHEAGLQSVGLLGRYSR